MNTQFLPHDQLKKLYQVVELLYTIDKRNKNKKLLQHSIINLLKNVIRKKGSE